MRHGVELRRDLPQRSAAHTGHREDQSTYSQGSAGQADRIDPMRHDLQRRDEMVAATSPAGYEPREDSR